MFAMWQLVLGKCDINGNVTFNLKKDVDFEKKLSMLSNNPVKGSLFQCLINN
jgi:hypothetical protein